jgi:hypothetical protein
LLVIAIVATTIVPAAAAPSEAVVVIASDPEFLTALGAALAPGGITTIAVGDPPPQVSELSPISRAIVEREHAASAVWLIASPTETTLIAYDHDVDRVLVRAVPYHAPFDPEQAAEMARMARTMLRALRVTPEIDLPPPHVEEARTVRARTARLGIPAPPRLDQLALVAGIGVRVGSPASDAGLDPALGVVWRPDGLGLAVQLGIAPRPHLGGMLAGTVADDTVAVLARIPLLGAARMRVCAFGGGSLHRIALRAELASGMAAHDERYDPAARAGVVASFQLARNLDLGLVVSSDFLLRRQRYDVGMEEVLVVPRVQLTTGLSLSLRIL